MRISTSIGLAAILIALSTSAFAASAAGQDHAAQDHATLLSPIIVYPSDTHVADNAPYGLHTGRSSARSTHAH